MYNLASMGEDFGNTRTKVAEYFYSKISKKAKQDKIGDFVFDNVKSIGIIYDKNSNDVNTFIQDISKEFKSKSGVISIFELAYNIEEDDKPEPTGIPIACFSDKDVNWYGRPKFKDVTNFLDTPFDLLINLAENDAWPIKFSAALSKAKFKVGRLQDNSNIYDFMVDTSNITSMSQFHSHILTFLRIINK